MCLDQVQTYGWKVFRVSNAPKGGMQLKSEFQRGWIKDDVVPQNCWLKAKDTNLRHTVIARIEATGRIEAEAYNLGFHIFANSRDAYDWKHGEGAADLSLVLRKVFFRGLLAAGYQELLAKGRMAPVLVAKEMYVVDADSPKRTLEECT